MGGISNVSTPPTVGHIAGSWNRHVYHVRGPAGTRPPVSWILADGVNGSSMDPAFPEASWRVSLHATVRQDGGYQNQY
jgi:hypothetical protein